MTQQKKQEIKAAVDRRAREMQAWWDEFEAFCQNPLHCTCQMISRDARECAVHGHIFNSERTAA